MSTTTPPTSPPAPWPPVWETKSGKKALVETARNTEKIHKALGPKPKRPSKLRECLHQYLDGHSTEEIFHENWLRSTLEVIEAVMDGYRQKGLDELELSVVESLLTGAVVKATKPNELLNLASEFVRMIQGIKAAEADTGFEDAMKERDRILKESSEVGA